MQGHNVTCYSKFSIPIDECEEDVESVVKECLLDYVVYLSNKKNNKENPNSFNFSFIVFDNTE